MSDEWHSYVIPTAGGKPGYFGGSGWPSFSRDGRWIYFGWDRTGRHEIWRMSTSGGDAVQITRNGAKAGFESADGRYIDLQTHEADLRFLSFATGNSTLIARNLGKVQRGLTASPSGRTILYARVDSSVDDLMMVEHFR